jgi:FkbH-like protein
MRLVEALEICRQPAPPDAPRFRAALLCGFTPLHLKTFFEAELRRRLPGRAVRVETGLYGDLLGNIERLGEVEAAAVALEWADLDPRLGVRQLGGWTRAGLEDICREAPRRLEAIGNALERLAAAGTVAAVSLPTLPLAPAPDGPSWRSGALELALRESLDRFAAALAQRPGLHVAGAASLAAVSPLTERFDLRSELSAGFPYTLAHAGALAAQLANLLAPAAPKKGLITDLDNTLWSGIVGEIGPAAVSWDLDRHSHEHGLYQQMLAALADRGVLLAAASKNDPEVVQAALARADLLLPRDALFPVEAHWGAKSESVRRILEAWNIGPDAVVFVDDSPMELDEVRRAHPAVECLLFPAGDPAGVWNLLGRLRDLFAKTAVSEEDLLRAASIRQNAARRQELAAASQSPEEFLAQAGGRIRYSHDRTDPRALELINKTNQFNLNGRRYTEAEWNAYVRDPQVIAIVVHYQDKYGPLGKIAVLTGRPQKERFLVDNWVMSCRAFSRRIEHQALAYLFARYGVRELLLDFRPTERNGPIRYFLAEITGREPDGTVLLGRSEFEARCPPLYHNVETVAG